MALQDGQWCARLQAPHSDGLVTGAGGDHGVFVADGHVRDLGSVSSERGQQTPVICSPDLHQAVV